MQPCSPHPQGKDPSRQNGGSGRERGGDGGSGNPRSRQRGGDEGSEVGLSETLVAAARRILYI
jgi:hypothetical protein